MIANSHGITTLRPARGGSSQQQQQQQPMRAT